MNSARFRHYLAEKPDRAPAEAMHRPVGRPVILSEHECGEVDFMDKREKAF